MLQFHPNILILRSIPFKDFPSSWLVGTLCSQCRGCRVDPWSENKDPIYLKIILSVDSWKLHRQRRVETGSDWFLKLVFETSREFSEIKAWECLSIAPSAMLLVSSNQASRSFSESVTLSYFAKWKLLRNLEIEGLQWGGSEENTAEGKPAGFCIRILEFESRYSDFMYLGQSLAFIHLSLKSVRQKQDPSWEWISCAPRPCGNGCAMPCV